MSAHPLSSVVEAVLLAAGRPVSVDQLLELFEETQRPPAEEVSAALADLQQSYEGRGIELREVASGWRVQIRPQYADVVSRLWQERPSRYSRALLETLALIAYRQPITRGEIEDIRGVTVSDDHHAHAARAQLDPRGRPPRGAGPSGTAGHDARVPRLLRPEEPRRPADAGRAARPGRHPRAARPAGGDRGRRRRPGARKKSPTLDDDGVAPVEPIDAPAAGDNDAAR